MYQLVIMDDVEEAALAASTAVEASPFAGKLSVSRVSGPEGLREILSGGGVIHILIADIRLDASADEARAGSPAAFEREGATIEANGIEVVRELLGRESATQVIYLTGYIEYCTEVYETDHVYFLTKPICQADFDRALARALDGLARAEPKRLVVKSGHAAVAVPFRDIVFIESRLRKLEIHTADAMHEVYGTIPDVLAELPRDFVRAHKSFVVNLSHVVRLDPDEFVLRTGERIPISKRRKQEVRAAFFSNLGR